ncbi:MFS transporter [Caulobacter segnis]
MRPIDAWVMGVYADRKGRKAGLTFSVTLMCAGSLMIAVTPSYDQIGIFAPIVLLIARLLQGLSVGGEYGASATYLSEMAGRQNRGFFSSFQYVTLISGQLIALCVLLLLQAILPVHDLEAWGWRIPFSAGGVLAIAVFYIRRGLAETDSFIAAKRDAKAVSSGWALFRHHPTQALTVVLLTAGGTAWPSTPTRPTCRSSWSTPPASAASPPPAITAAALFVYMLLQPVAGALSDRIGRKPLMVGFGAFLGVAFTFIIFRTPGNHQQFVCSLPAGSGAALIIVTGYTAINAVVKAELFRPISGRWAWPCPTPWPTRSSAAPPNTWRCGSRARVWSAASTSMSRS